MPDRLIRVGLPTARARRPGPRLVPRLAPWFIIGVLLLLLLLLLLSGCASGPYRLMPTPVGFTPPAERSIFAGVPRSRRTPHQDLLYITNRQSEAGLHYGEGRSSSLAYGSATVRMLPVLSWSQLAKLSLSDVRKPEVTLDLGAVRELGRFPPEPYPVEVTPAGIRREPSVMRLHEAAAEALRAEISRRLESAPSGRVMLYVHGFNETFASASYTAAELCHFFGRDQVCAFFTWPASASGNILTAFAHTTESAQFSIGHLKQTIRDLALVPGVEGIVLLAHSRGAALLLDALRELYIETIAAGVAPAQALKLDQIVLLSADVDAEVATQRVLVYGSDPDMITRWDSPWLPELFRGRVTVYASPQDRALLVSRILFRSGNRIGQLTPDAIQGPFTDLFNDFGRLDIVTYDGRRTDFLAHSQFTSNPRVSADLITLIRTGAAPDDPRRGLVPTGPISWGFPPAGASGRAGQSPTTQPQPTDHDNRQALHHAEHRHAGSGHRVRSATAPRAAGNAGGHPASPANRRPARRDRGGRPGRDGRVQSG